MGEIDRLKTALVQNREDYQAVLETGKLSSETREEIEAAIALIDATLATATEIGEALR